MNSWKLLSLLLAGLLYVSWRRDQGGKPLTTNGTYINLGGGYGHPDGQVSDPMPSFFPQATPDEPTGDVYTGMF